MGRPKNPNQAALVEEICERLAKGEGLKEILSCDGMPGRRTFFTWLHESEIFQHQYARAREAWIEHMAEELLEIADNSTNDWIDRQSERGNIIRTFDHEHAQRSRLRVDTRKWLMSKLAPRVYGEATEPDAPSDDRPKPKTIKLKPPADPRATDDSDGATLH